MRTNKNIQSVAALSELLREVALDPKAFVQNSDLATAIKSQGALAKLTDKEHEIRGMSLNTLKRVANESLAGGWHHLDGLRLAAVKTIAEVRASSQREHRDTKRAKDARIQIQNGALEKQYRVNLILLRVIKQLMDDLGSIRDSKSEMVRSRLTEESTQRARLSLLTNPPPFENAERSKIVSFERRS